MTENEEEEEEEDDMETEDRDSEEAEKPSIITFDPSLPTSHAVSNATVSFLQKITLHANFIHVYFYLTSARLTCQRTFYRFLHLIWCLCVDTDPCGGSTWVQTWRSFMAVQSTMTTAVRPSLCCLTRL